jgi:DNA ligase-associated metallophosphoesterase
MRGSGSAAVRDGSGAALGPTAHLRVGDAELVADVSGVLWWPSERTLLVADLHLEKGSSRAVLGALLPPYDTRDTLARLAATIARFRPRTVVALGDSLHDGRACDRLSGEDRAALATLQRGRAWVWVTGNHDPEAAIRLDGEIVSELEVGGLRLCHDPGATSGEGCIAGHLHPVARIETRGQHLRRRCFVGAGNRLVMPAFGAFTGGLNVLDPAFAAVWDGSDRRVLMLGRDAVYPVPVGLLRPD